MVCTETLPKRNTSKAIGFVFVKKAMLVWKCNSCIYVNSAIDVARSISESIISNSSTECTHYAINTGTFLYHNESE